MRISDIRMGFRKSIDILVSRFTVNMNRQDKGWLPEMHILVDTIN